MLTSIVLMVKYLKLKFNFNSFINSTFLPSQIFLFGCAICWYKLVSYADIDLFFMNVLQSISATNLFHFAYELKWGRLFFLTGHWVSKLYFLPTNGPVRPQYEISGHLMPTPKRWWDVKVRGGYNAFKQQRISLSLPDLLSASRLSDHEAAKSLNIM